MKTPMTHRYTCWIPAALMAASVGLAGCQDRNEFVPPPPPKVTVALPLQQMVQEHFQTTGQTRAVNVVELRARVGGYLERIEFKDGDLVEKGQLLFVLDRAPFEAAVASAEAALAKAEAQLQLAESQLNRTQSLAEQQAVTESTLEIEQAKQAAAAADVAAAKAALRMAQLDLNYAEINAPFAGRMGRHMVDVGNLVESGTTLLAPLESIDPIHAYFTLSESDLLRFMRMQQEGTLTISEKEPIVIELALGEGEAEQFQFRGTLDFREFGIDPETGTTQRRAVFPNSDGRLVPGLFVRLRAAVGEPRPMLVVAERAVGADQRGDYLLVVNSENVVEYRPVKLGLLKDGLRAIESGIDADDHVVINGLQRARPGTEVQPELAEMGSQLAADTTAPAEPAGEQPAGTTTPAPAGGEPAGNAPAAEPTAPQSPPPTESAPGSSSSSAVPPGSAPPSDGSQSR